MQYLKPQRMVSPPRLVLKLNFDGAARGNPGAAGFGATCRNLEGEILHLLFGSIGEDTNNSTKLEGMLQGVKIVIREGWMPTMVEGDSLILIQMAKQLSYKRSTEKVSSSWCLSNRLEFLRGLILSQPAMSFHHV